MQTLAYQGWKISKAAQAAINDSLVVEAPLQININNQAFTVVMRTPGHDFDLVRGLLYAEDVCKDSQSLVLETLEQTEVGASVINASIDTDKLGKGYLTKRSLLSVSSCGICGKQELDNQKHTGQDSLAQIALSRAQIYKMFDTLQQDQQIFKQTGGSHAAGIFSREYQALVIREDIGRHNAVDKCVGYLMEKNQLKKGKILLVSGRVSYEIISKAFLARIPLVVAVSACSSLAVDFAKEMGICLVGFSREDKMTIYANPSYLTK